MDAPRLIADRARGPLHAGLAAHHLVPGSAHRRLVVALAVGLLLLAATALVTGCTRQSGARADSRETRLTHDGAPKSALRFSPDGQLLAFGQRVGAEEGMFAVFVMPTSGGTPKRISPDSLGVFPLRWAEDGRSLFCLAFDGKTLYRVGLDQSVELVRRADPLTRIVDVTPDGASELALMFNRDNYDLGLRRAGGITEVLVPTPQWEEGASFGPGPDHATVVSASSFQAPLSTIAIRPLAGGEDKPLPLPEGRKGDPQWSPDGQRMAYVASGEGQLDVWLYDPATARAIPAVQDPQDTGCPSWSPDGEWLAFCRISRSSHLFLGEPGAADRRQLTSGPATDVAPTVSPDGRWVAFLRRPAAGSEGADAPRLCVMPAGGGEVHELPLTGLTIPTKGSEISWAWDSQDIVFSAREASTGLDVYRVRRDGTQLARITVEPGDEIDPRFSPDGRLLSYTRVGGGRTQVAVLPSNGGVSRTLSPEGRVSEGTAWSPDSRSLVYCSILGDGSFELWQTPVSGPGEPRRVLADPVLAWPMFWARDGGHLILLRGKGADWWLSELALETGVERRIGRMGLLPSTYSMHAELLPEGEKYRSLFYPGGVILADGEQTGDLYMVRTRDLLENRQISAGGQSFLWFARTSWADPY